MKKSIMILFVTIATSFMWAGYVSVHEAEQIGSDFLSNIGNSNRRITTIENYYDKVNPGLPAFYIIRSKPLGFALIAAEEQSTPILGYSPDSIFPEGEIAPNVKWLLDLYARAVTQIRENPDWPYNEQWNNLRNRDFGTYNRDNIVFVPVNTKWGQGQYYNDLCPTDPNVDPVYNGHVPAGCVAVAMAQIIRYYEQPYQGYGSNSYTPADHPEYGLQSVNFTNARYDYRNMPDNLTAGNTDVARLIYHCGVSVNMNYGPQSSSASDQDAANAFVNHFRFNSADYQLRSNFEDALWLFNVKSELDIGRPVYYRGYDPPPEPSAAHAFVLHGYYGNSFQINWGWNGGGDGLYTLDNLSPGSNLFSQNQGAIFNLFPLPAPGPPSGLAVTAVNPFCIKLSWVDGSADEEGFCIERRTGSNPDWAQIHTSGSNVTSYYDTEITSGLMYEYRIRSYNPNGHSAYTNIMQIGAPYLEQPLEAQIQKLSNNQVKIEWDVHPNASSYALYKSGTLQPEGSPLWTQVYNGSGLSYIDNTNASQQFYYVRVQLSVPSIPGLVYIPGGSFTMGDTRGVGFSYELPTHTVTLNSFYMGKYEVTQTEYSQYIQPYHNWTSYYGLGDYYPAYYVSWYAILKYCNLRSMAEGLTPVYTISGSTNPANWGTVPTSSNNATWNAAICNWNANGYRLPTEAEWEYAARGATNIPDYLYSGSDDINAVAWYYDNNTPYGSKPVGGKAANGLGLYDMSGNVFEWCWDWWNSTYYSDSPVNNPTGPSSGSLRLLRSGYWGFSARLCRVTERYYRNPYDGGHPTGGFRIVRSN